MTEVAFQKWLMAEAKKHGWIVNHHRRALVRGKDGNKRWVTNTSVPGWPDLCLIRPPLVVFLELKKDRKAVLDAPEAQRRIIGLLQQCYGVYAYIVCPDDIPALSRLLGTNRANLTNVTPGHPQGS